MRYFHLMRHTDVSGTSGTGIVAEGIQLSSGKVVMEWLTETSSIVIYQSIEDVIKIHGHDGATEMVWMDEIKGKVFYG